MGNAVVPGGQDAERQWRLRLIVGGKAGEGQVPGGQDAERQWRQNNVFVPSIGQRSAGGPRRRKAMETERWQSSCVDSPVCRGAKTPKGNGDRRCIARAS